MLVCINRGQMTVLKTALVLYTYSSTGSENNSKRQQTSQTDKTTNIQTHHKFTTLHNKLSLAVELRESTTRCEKDIIMLG